jgi:hypothetical protein
VSYPVLDYVSPRRERQLRREWKAAYKARGMKYPRLPTVGFVEVTAIRIPEWAWAKRIKGLTDTNKSIWLRRILARELMREDEDAGGTPRVTWTSMRKCRICRRVLLGPEAENRFMLDLKFTGEWTACGPECLELEASRIESKQQLNRQGKRKGK